MLVALLQTQVAEYWSLLRDHINDSLPPIADYGPLDMNNILHTLMVGGAVCWLVVDENHVTVGFIVTTTLKDMSGVKTLLVYSVVVLSNTSSKHWVDSAETLRKYARSKNCSKIVAFINNEKLLSILKEYGAETTTFVSFKI